MAAQEALGSLAGLGLIPEPTHERKANAMTKFISGFGDKMLSRVLGKETAGACIAERGQPCGGTWQTGNGYCYGGRYHYQVCDKTYDCYGNCVETEMYCWYVAELGLVC